MGLIYNIFNMPVSNQNRFFCSEFVYHILEESNIINLNISRNLVRPQNFLHIGGKIIFTGDLKMLKLQENIIHIYTT